MEPTVSVEHLLDKVLEIAPIIREHSAAGERERRLAQPVVDAMLGAGLFRMWVPKAFGGLELDPMATFRVIEEIARIDSAAAWNLQISTAASALYAWFENDSPKEIFAETPDVVIAAAFSPPAQIVPVEGGYRLSGRWSFGSGCQYSSWFIGPSVVMDGDEPQVSSGGDPIQLMITFRAEDVEILDTWHTLGMRGTGSHDFVAKDVFLPERHTAPLVPLEKLGTAYEGALYRYTIWHAIAILAPPALGVARAAIDELVELAKRKTPRYTRSTVRERQVAQAQVAQAEALLGAGRAYLYEALRDVWDTAVQGEMINLNQKIKLQLASTYAIQAAAQAVDLVHGAAGATAIREESAIQRHFRDVHTITQHAFTSASRYESVGQLLFGLESEWGGWFAL